VITYEKVSSVAPEKAWNTWGIFFSYFVVTLWKVKMKDGDHPEVD